jgi:hypothetical protein
MTDDVLLDLPVEYGEWLDALFTSVRESPHWLWSGDYDGAVIGPARLFLANCRRLFESSGFLFERYSIRQIDEGFWRIVQFLDAWLDSVHLDITTRLAVIELMPRMFEDCLAHVSCETCYTAFMWWDCLRSLSGEYSTVKTPDLPIALGQAMIAMLRSQHEMSIRSAIHGLGHLVRGSGDDDARHVLQRSDCGRRTSRCGPEWNSTRRLRATLISLARLSTERHERGP